jgi:hypothetical protein
VAFSKHVTHYDPWSGFLYYNLTTRHREGSPIHHLGMCWVALGLRPGNLHQCPVVYIILTMYLLIIIKCENMNNLCLCIGILIWWHQSDMHTNEIFVTHHNIMTWPQCLKWTVAQSPNATNILFGRPKTAPN